MSLGVFATSRMAEVPLTAMTRGELMGKRCGGHPLATTALMSGAAWLLTYSYTQIHECLCVFSGHGVSLTGVPLYCMLGLLMIAPALNAVCQEVVMTQLETPPLLLLAVQNI